MRRLLLVVVLAAPFLASIVVVAPSPRGVPALGGAGDAPPLLGVLTANDSCRILGVLPSSPAERAGLEAGDIIDRVDGTPVTNPRQLRRLLAGRPPGAEVMVGIVRAARTLEIRVTFSSAQPRVRTPSSSPTHP